VRLAAALCAAVVGCTACQNGELDAFEPQTASEPLGLLDDFEDQDNRAGQDGWWYETDDGTGPEGLMTFEAVTDRGQSLHAIRLRAGPTQDYGAFLGLDLPGGVFDASEFRTLSFAARAEPPQSLGLTLLDTIFDNHDTSVDITSEWQNVTVPLTDFVNADAAVVDSSQLTHLQFWVRGPSEAFDLWIDDVWLLPER